MSRIAASWRSLPRLVRDKRTELSLALRTTMAALSGFALSRWLHVPMPLWTVLTAVILTQLSFGSSLRATIEYLIGTLGGALYTGIVAALISPTSATATAGVLAIAVAPLALLAAINPRFRAAPFTGALVILLPGLTHVGPVESAFDRVLEVAIGGVTAVAVSLLVFPMRARSLATAAAAEMLALSARCLPELFAGFVQARDSDAAGRMQDSIGQAFARLDALAAEARHERIAFLAAEPDQGPLLRTLLRLRHDFVMVGRAAAQPLPEILQARLAPLLEAVAAATADYLRHCGEALVVQRDPASVETVEIAVNRFTAAFTVVRSEHLTWHLALDAVERLYTLAFALEQMNRNLVDLDRCARDSGRGSIGLTWFNRSG